MLFNKQTITKQEIRVKRNVHLWKTRLKWESCLFFYSWSVLSLSCFFKKIWHTLNGIHIFHCLFLVCLFNRLSAPLPSSLCLPYHGVIHLSALFVSPPACTLTFCSVKHYCKAVTRNRCSRPIYSEARVSGSQLRAETDSIRVPGSCVTPLLLLRSLSSGISFLLASRGRQC